MKTDSEESKQRRSAYAAALALLARREHSRAELAQKLAQREYAPAEVDPALDALTDSGLLSDERAVRARISSGLRRGHGPGRIRQALHQAGLPNEAVIAGIDDETIDWISQARSLAERKFGSEAPDDYREWARRARFLQSRGYDTETIRKALGRD
jgi:regulatory protein